MSVETFKVDGWLGPLYCDGDSVGVCGRSVGLTVAVSAGGGVMDYHEVARLHTYLGDWLRRVEQGQYQAAAKSWDEKLKTIGEEGYPCR